MLFSAFLASAQNNLRVVRGYIYDESGQPVKDVTISTSSGETFRYDEAGFFEVRVPSIRKTLSFSSPSYITIVKEIDGSVLSVVMVYDREAEEKARKEALAKEKAEEEARIKAEEERKAAEEAARREAEEKAEAEERARIQAEEAARKEEEAKARAEEWARIKAEKERLAAERKQKDAEYSSSFQNKGLSHSVSISYAYELNQGIIIYHYSGQRSYGALHPIEADYTMSYKVNRLFSIGAGVGCLYNAKSITIVGDEFASTYPDSFQEKRLDVPVFATARISFLRTSLRPFVSLTGGWYLLSSTPKGNAGIGCEYRVGKRFSMDVQGQLSMVPWPVFGSGTAQYQMVMAPGISLGVGF